MVQEFSYSALFVPFHILILCKLGLLGPLHGRGGGDGGGDHEDSASLGFSTSSPTGETVRRRSPPVKAQLFSEMSPVMGGWRGRARWPLGGTV
jgi:hypothetical protein